MDQAIIFSSGKKTIEVNGLDALVQFSHYDPNKPELFLDGIELSEDLESIFGTVFYAKGTQINPQRVSRLIELRASNPSLDFIFNLKQSIILIQNFRKEIKQQFFELLDRQSRSKDFSYFVSQIDVNIKSFIDDVLSDENITLALYQVRFLCQNSEKSRAELFFEHSINVALFSIAIATSEEYAKIVGKDKTKLVDIYKVGLFHNYGALNIIDTIFDVPEDKRLDVYWDANRKGYSALDKHLFNFDTLKTLHYLGKYYFGEKDFVKSNDWPAIMANIVLVADAFISKESGLFEKPQQVRKVVDYLNVKVTEKELNQLPVLALTKGLNLHDIFDFYKELSTLIKECPYDSGVAYPFVGFKSPTVFVCKKEVKVCKHIDSNKKAVNLIKQLGELKPGQYRLCRYLTKKLQTFYNKHYLEIKDSISVKEKLG